MALPIHVWYPAGVIHGAIKDSPDDSNPASPSESTLLFVRWQATRAHHID